MSKEKLIDRNLIWIIALILILAAAFFVRFNNLSWETYGYGEVEIKQAADEYLKGNFVNNFYIFDTPPFSKYIFAASIAFFGESEFALRVIPLIFGVLTVAALFFMAKKMYNTKLALLAASLTAFSILQIQFSRYAQLETMLSFFYILIAYFTWDAVHNSKKYTFVFLGVFIGLAMATKFTSIIILVSVIAYAIYARHIRLSIRPNFSLNISNWVIKAILISIVLFFIVWPFGFARLHADANISVDYGGTLRSQEIKANVPIFLLSFSRRIFTSVSEQVNYPILMEIPVVNYFLLYITKESILVVVLLTAGIYFMLKKPAKPDVLIAIVIITFLVLLSFQRTLISYRHITPVVPFLSVLAARWIYGLKKRWLAITAVIAILMFAYAAITGPAYSLSYNPMKNVFGIQDTESRDSEGMRETIGYIENCSSTYAGDYYRFMIEPYYKNVTTDFNSTTACAVKGNIDKGFEGGDAAIYIEKRNCTLAKTVSKNSIKLIEIYRC